MEYCFNPDLISLDMLKERILSTDLVPSREALREGLDPALQKLADTGLSTLGKMRKELKDNKRLFAIAEQTGIDKDYLALLRREAESYFPKPFALREFDWIPDGVIENLEKAGIRNTADLFEKPDVARSSRIAAEELDHMLCCADLTRIQWISPLAARMLIAAGYDTPATVAAANPDELDQAMLTVNSENQYFKGRIGLRDIKRLVHAARYVTLWY